MASAPMRLSQLRATGTDRKWSVLAAMTGSLAMILLDTMMIGVALPTIELARAVQGASAAAMIPASLAIVVDAFPPGERGPGTQASSQSWKCASRERRRTTDVGVTPAEVRHEGSLRRHEDALGSVAVRSVS